MRTVDYAAALLKYIHDSRPFPLVRMRVMLWLATQDGPRGVGAIAEALGGDNTLSAVLTYAVGAGSLKKRGKAGHFEWELTAKGKREVALVLNPPRLR